MGVQIPPWKGAIWMVEGAARCEVWGLFVVSCAKTAELTMMPFALPYYMSVVGVQIWAP